jgi:hypothetical protein
MPTTVYLQTVADSCREILARHDELVAMDAELIAKAPGGISRAEILKDEIEDYKAKMDLAQAQAKLDEAIEKESIPESRRCKNVCPACHHVCGHDLAIG